MATPRGGISGTLGEGLIGFWSFDGNTNDQSVSKNNLIGYSGTIPTYSTDIDGNPNRCLGDMYSQGGGLIPINPDIILQNEGDPFSISFWYIHDSSTPDYRQLIATDRNLSSPARSGIVITYVSGDLYIACKYNGYRQINMSDEWHNIVVSYNGGTDPVKIYIDGSYYGNVYERPPVSASVSKELMIGGISGYQESMDEVRIYNRALTDSEVSEIYNLSVNYTLTFQTKYRGFNENKYKEQNVITLQYDDATVLTIPAIIEGSKAKKLHGYQEITDIYSGWETQYSATVNVPKITIRDMDLEDYDIFEDKWVADIPFSFQDQYGNRFVAMGITGSDTLSLEERTDEDGRVFWSGTLQLKSNHL